MRLRVKYKRVTACLLLALLSCGTLYVIGVINVNNRQVIQDVTKVADHAGVYRAWSSNHEKDVYHVDTIDTGTKSHITSHRTTKICNTPNQRYFGSEGLAPGNYKLLSVHTLLLHGDIAPSHRIVASKTLSCLIDTNLFSQLDKVRQFVPAMKAAKVKLPRNSSFFRWALFPSRFRCSEGELTGLGAIQQVLNGLHYNVRYMHGHQLFNETNWPEKIIAHTTHLSSTFQSTIAFLYGLLPNFKLEKINLKGTGNNFFCAADSKCDWMNVDSFRKKAHQECKMKTKYLELIEKYKYIKDNIKSVLNIQQQNNLYFAAILKELNSYICHNIPLPCNSRDNCISTESLEPLWEVVDFHSNCINKNNNYRKFARVIGTWIVV